MVINLSKELFLRQSMTTFINSTSIRWSFLITRFKTLRQMKFSSKNISFPLSINTIDDFLSFPSVSLRLEYAYYNQLYLHQFTLELSFLIQYEDKNLIDDIMYFWKESFFIRDNDININMRRNSHEEKRKTTKDNNTILSE